MHRLLNWLSPIPFPRWVQRAAGRLQAALLRRLGGRGPLTSGILVLTTRGRRSGKARSTTLLHFDIDGSRYVVASFAGVDEHPAWYLNLLADPHVEVEASGARTTCVARVVGAEEHASLWPRLDAAYPGFARYRARTSRAIPIVELRPDADGRAALA